MKIRVDSNVYSEMHATLKVNTTRKNYILPFLHGLIVALGTSAIVNFFNHLSLTWCYLNAAGCILT